MKIKCILDVEGGQRGSPLFICGKEYEVDNRLLALDERGIAQRLIGFGQWFDSHFTIIKSIPCPHFGIGTSCYMSFPLKCKEKPCELYADQPPETVVCPTCKGVGRVAK